MKLAQQTPTKLIFKVLSKYQALAIQLAFAFLIGDKAFSVLNSATKQLNHFNITTSLIWDVITLIGLIFGGVCILLTYNLYVPQAYIFDKELDKLIVRYRPWFNDKLVEYALSEILDVSLIQSRIRTYYPLLTLVGGKSLIFYSFWTPFDFARQKNQSIVDLIRSFLDLS